MPDPMGSLHPLPTSMPNDLIDRAIALIGGAAWEMEDVHRLWHVAGAIIAKFDTHQPKGAVATASPEQAIAALEAMKAGMVGAFDWKPLLKLILTLIQQYLG